MKFNKQKLVEMIEEEIYEMMGMRERTSRDDLIGNISDMFKEMHGIRPRFYKFSEMSDEEIRRARLVMSDEQIRSALYYTFVADIKCPDRSV